MNKQWFSDFSYCYYRQLLHAIKENFTHYLFSEFTEISGNHPKRLYTNVSGDEFGGPAT